MSLVLASINNPSGASSALKMPPALSAITSGLTSAVTGTQSTGTSPTSSSSSLQLPKPSVGSALQIAAGAVALTAFPQMGMFGMGAGMGAFAASQAFSQLVLPMTPQRNSQNGSSTGAAPSVGSALSTAGGALTFAMMSGLAQANKERNDPNLQAQRAEAAREKTQKERDEAQRLADETERKMAEAQRRRFLYGHQNGKVENS